MCTYIYRHPAKSSLSSSKGAGFPRTSAPIYPQVCFRTDETMHLVLVLLVFGTHIKVGTTARPDSLQELTLTRIEKIWQNMGDSRWDLVVGHKGGEDFFVVSQFKDITDRMTKGNILNKLDNKFLGSKWGWGLIIDHSNKIEKYFKEFRRILIKENTSKYLETFANNLGGTQNSSDLLNVLKVLQSLIVKENHQMGNPTVYDEVFKEGNLVSSICTTKQSPQQLLFNLHSILQLTQIKAYTMIQFSWMILKIHKKGNFTEEPKWLQEKFNERLKQQNDEIKKSLTDASRDVWTCSPRIHIKGESYTEITKLLQGFVVNEKDLSKEPNCDEDCGFFSFTKQYSTKSDFAARQQTCKGNVVNCQYIDSDMWICPSPMSSARRYDWIEYENGRVLGQKGKCSRGVTKVDSWWTWMFYHCSYCLCQCDDYRSPASDRYFNLRSVTTDTDENKVITGLRFLKTRKVIHLQIQHGTLLPKGSINETSITWKPVDNYNTKDAQEGKDYHMLTHSKRAIDIDDLLGPQDSVLTGIRFRVLGSHLNLEIQVSKIDFETGQILGSSVWIGNDNTELSQVPRSRIEIKSPSLPTGTESSETPLSHNKFLEFTASSLDGDASQSTVPFIDTQLVQPDPPVPLSGAGIYYKLIPNTGGFIAPKVITYDFNLNMND